MLTSNQKQVQLEHSIRSTKFCLAQKKGTGPNNVEHCLGVFMFVCISSIIDSVKYSMIDNTDEKSSQNLVNMETNEKMYLYGTQTISNIVWAC